MITDNLILINGCTYTAVKKAVMEYLERYFEYEQNIGVTFELYKIKQEEHAIICKKLTSRLFFHLVSHLNNTSHINISKTTITGYTTGDENNILKNKTMLVFVSPDDFEYSVSVVTNNNAQYRVELDGKIVKVENKKDYVYPTGLNLQKSEIIKVSDIFHKKEDISNIKAIKRFTIGVGIIVIVALALLALLHPTLSYMKESLIEPIAWTGYLLGLWLALDYKILRINLLYSLSLLISVGYLMIGFCLDSSNEFKSLHFLFFYPLLMLLLQFPLRKIYLKIYKREPTTEHDGPIADRIYGGIIMVIPIPLSFGVEELIKLL
ncbi:hypothetical protein D0T50_07335 [Bacteroides sp. 214]|uniref:hypothetical protein n=1 Tax=Bacteroides sp. 214 TaxID=2302935 RepID=UPI0013D8979E|nr:hypothetical protein [Bacteroides sp. 214]NDW12700.1 hypothetical protein [Bacteroides sp. 214]